MGRKRRKLRSLVKKKTSGTVLPKVEMEKKKVNVAEFNKAVKHLINNDGVLETKISEDIKNLWFNEAALKYGLDSAEFNLRAHQKVLNGLTTTLLKIIELIKQDTGSVVELEVKLAQASGEDGAMVKFVDWPFYHAAVEADLSEQPKIEAPVDSVDAVPKDVQIQYPEGSTFFGG